MVEYKLGSIKITLNACCDEDPDITTIPCTHDKCDRQVVIVSCPICKRTQSGHLLERIEREWNRRDISKIVV